MSDKDEQISKIAIYTGTPAEPYESVGEVKATLKATTAFSRAPTEDEANWKLREKALKLGANAVINVAYDRQTMGLTGWKPLTARGEAVVIRESAPQTRAQVLAICPQCYERVPIESKFCTECGAKMGPQEPVCPGCGEKVTPDDKFCPECGAKLKPKR